MLLFIKNMAYVQYDADETVFDVSMREYVNTHRNVMIEEMRIGATGDIIMTLADSSVIQIIPNRTDDEEAWRFMIFTDKED